MGSEEDAGLWWGVGEIRIFQRWGEGLGLGGGESAPRKGGGSGERAQDHRSGWSHRVLGRTWSPWDFPEDSGGLGRATGCREGISSLREGAKVLGRDSGSGGGAHGVRGRAWNWVIGKESGEGHWVQERNLETREGQVDSGRGAESEMGAPRVWGGMCDWERALGPGEQHRIHRKSTGSWEETRILG